MIELLHHLLNLDWRRRGGTVRELEIDGSRVWFVEFQPRPLAPPTLRRSLKGRVSSATRPPTAVLLHGLGDSSASFYSLIPQLRRLYRVIVPDLPGHGRSRPPAGQKFLPFPRLVEVTEKFVAQVAGRGAYLAGNSMGGWIAVKVAARRPDLVRAMALLNPGGPALRAEDWVDLARILMAEERGAPDEWMNRVFHKAPLAVRLFKKDFHRIMRGPPVSQLVTSLQAEDFLSEAEIARVRCPATLVWGERDRFLPDGCRAFYLKKLKGVRYEPVPDCGHCPQLECPSRTAEILLELPTQTVKSRRSLALGGGRVTVAPRARGGLDPVARAPRD
ncbi:MAG TPA: alpha/beta hydrolase [Anaeromyxobacteraceae bacterium]|nr:alpha/beta hydrolase [Anaeromyxobacteraceae bacterium]